MLTMTRREALASVELALLVGLFLFLAPAVAREGMQDGSGQKETQERKPGPWTIRGPDEARRRALSTAGVEKEVAATAKLIKLANDQTPFLADKLNGREV